MRRRDFIRVVSGVAIVWPAAARAQQSTTKIPRVGWLVAGSPTTYRFSLAAFLDGLKAAGRVEGQNIKIEYRWGEGNLAQFPELAEDLVRQKVDVILAGGSIGAEVAKRATSVIPIVAAGVSDLIDLGLVSNLTRPDGNLTGFVANAPELSAKRLQIIKEIKPELKRAAILWNSGSSNAQLEWKPIKEFATANNIEVTLYDAQDDVEGLKTALASISPPIPDVLVVLNDPFMFAQRKIVVDAALKSYSCLQSMASANLWTTEGFLAMGRAAGVHIVGQPIMSTKSSKAQRSLIFRSCCRRSLSLSSISQRPRQLG